MKARTELALRRPWPKQGITASAAHSCLWTLGLIDGGAVSYAEVRAYLRDTGCPRRNTGAFEINRQRWTRLRRHYERRQHGS